MLLLHAPAKVVTCSKCECFYLYTDASLEVKDGSPVAGLGGVLVSPEAEPWSSFSWFPDCDTASKVGIDLNTKCIFLLELLAVCMGFWMWSKRFRSCDLVCFTDNEAAKACLVKGSSAHEVANKLLFFQALKRKLNVTGSHGSLGSRPLPTLPTPPQEATPLIPISRTLKKLTSTSTIS